MRVENIKKGSDVIDQIMNNDQDGSFSPMSGYSNHTSQISVLSDNENDTSIDENFEITRESKISYQK